MPISNTVVAITLSFYQILVWRDLDCEFKMAQRSAAAEDIVSSFKKILETDVAVPVAAMNSLVYYIVV